MSEVRIEERAGAAPELVELGEESLSAVAGGLKAQWMDDDKTGG